MKAFRVETIAGLTAMLAAVTKLVNDMLRDEQIALIEVKQGERGRTGDQNRLIHAILGDISDQVELNGRQHSIHVWKRLTVAEWLKESGERPLIIQDLSGEVLVLWEKTSKMTTKQMASYIEWLYAFAADNDVKLREPK